MGLLCPASLFCQKPAPEISYRLKWLLNTSVAGDIYADKEGFFKENGLHVLVKPGGPEKDAMKELELGRAHFGVASADQIIRALDKGSKVKVIAQLFAVNPLQWIYRPDKTHITGPEDLKKKIIGITYGGIDENIMKALLGKHGIKESQVYLYSVRYDFTPFYQGKVDLWPIYRNAQGPIIGARMEKAGEKIDYFNPDAHGIHTVANSVITSEDILQKQPELVEKFLGALLKGWEMSMDPAHAEKTVSLIQKADPDTAREVITEQLGLTRPFIKPMPDYKIGTINVPAWKQTEQMMLDQGLIGGPVEIEKHLKIQ
jgi:NitT/TauT family transport system substrate-binding protein